MKRSWPSIIAGAALVAILVLYMITYQVRFNEVAVARTFGKITPPRPEFLFAVSAELRSDLDAGTIPAALAKAFKKHDVTLSGKAEISLEQLDEEAGAQAERRWGLVDDVQRYLLEQDKDAIKVYELVSKDVITKPGLKWKWPWPIQRATVYDNRMQLTETVGEETPTRDTKNVIVTTAVGWRIDDPHRFSILNTSIVDAEDKLKTLIRNEQKTVIGNYDFANFVSTDDDELQYDDIEVAILRTVKPLAKELYEIKVEYVGIEKLALPKRITEDVFTAMQEERNAQAARYTSEGKAKATEIKGEAKKIADTITDFAERKAAEIVAVGMRRAARYNETFRQDEPLAVFLFLIDALPDILKERTTMILKSPFDLLREVEDTLREMEDMQIAGPATRPAPGANVPAGPSAADVATPDMIRPK